MKGFGFLSWQLELELFNSNWLVVGQRDLGEGLVDVDHLFSLGHSWEFLKKVMRDFQ